MFGLEAQADEAAGEVLEAGDGGEDAEGEGWGEGAGVAEDAVEDLVGEGLELLGAADGGGAVGLDPLEVVRGEGVGEEGFGEDVGGGDGIL